MIQSLFGSLNEPERKSVFGRMKDAVSRTRETLGERVDAIVAVTREVDQATLDELEMSLLSSDLGVRTTNAILDGLREQAKRKEIKNGAELKALLKQRIRSILEAERERNYF